MGGWAAAENDISEGCSTAVLISGMRWMGWISGSYILKATQSADSAFQCQKFCDKSAYIIKIIIWCQYVIFVENTVF